MLRNGIAGARSTVGVMGVTFKENCPDIRNSKVMDLINELKLWNVNVIVTDAWANSAEVEHEYGIQLGTIDEHTTVDALVVAVGHNEYRQMAPQELRKFCRGEKPVLADVKALYDRRAATDAGFTVFRL